MDKLVKQTVRSEREREKKRTAQCTLHTVHCTLHIERRTLYIEQRMRDCVERALNVHNCDWQQWIYLHLNNYAKYTNKNGTRTQQLWLASARGEQANMVEQYQTVRACIRPITKGLLLSLVQ